VPRAAGHIGSEGHTLQCVAKSLPRCLGLLSLLLTRTISWEGALVSPSALYTIYIICGMFTMQDTLITN
jgi:hypothetical protein